MTKRKNNISRKNEEELENIKFKIIYNYIELYIIYYNMSAPKIIQGIYFTGLILTAIAIQRTVKYGTYRLQKK